MEVFFQTQDYHVETLNNTGTAALELTDDLSGILKGILEKLNKLDTIERAVKKIEGSLLKLEERRTKLKALEKTAR